MDKSTWVKSIILVYLGTIFGLLMSPNQQLQDFLYRYISPQWRSPMGLLILVGGFVGLLIWYWRLSVNSAKKKTRIELLIEAIAIRLGIDVDKFNEDKPKKEKKEAWMKYHDSEDRLRGGRGD